ncbi:MAG: TSUP family transporter [Gammaproteobacteria bacterium]|nr:TSUP family transporter [Gammaproteobacteria bacterium]
MTLELGLLALAGFFAGFVDAVAGGGGLLQLPALFAAYPETHAATLFGTNKAASVWGTAVAARQYGRRVALPWACLKGALPMALIGAWGGAKAVSLLPTAALRPAVLVALIGVGLYTLRRRELGLTHAPRFGPTQELKAGAALGLGLGFYDGIFGPGTGTFLVFMLVRNFGYDFLHASAAAKLINVATNVAALAFFIPAGHWLGQAAVVLAVSNVAGSVLGSRAALKGGARFVRLLFLLVITLLLVKMAFDVWHERTGFGLLL